MTTKAEQWDALDPFKRLEILAQTKQRHGEVRFFTPIRLGHMAEVSWRGLLVEEREFIERFLEVPS